jgi:hypothetical protein
MNKIFIKFLPIALLVLMIVLMGFRAEDEKNSKIKKPSINDDHKFIAVNQILMWIANNGDGSHDPRTGGNGFYWPGGLNATKSAIFQDGLIYGARVGREIRVNGNTHRQGLQAGKIINGVPDNPDLEKYRVYKIVDNWESLPPGPDRDAYQKDYEEWPIEDGAPYVDVDGDGMPTPGVDIPRFLGNETLWYVANDMDPDRSTGTYGMLPMGLEFQTTVFGFRRTGALGDMVFKKYKIINKGSITLRDMVVAYWSDTDLGDAADDYTGCDTVLSLGYTYNGKASDGIYGIPPPAVGYDFFQGPIVPGAPTDSAKFDEGYKHGYRNLPLTAFTLYLNSGSGFDLYRDPRQGEPVGSIEFYNYLTGFAWDGTPFIDPTTGQPSKFVVPGDPVTGTGWYEGPGWPGGPPPFDRRHVMASGPFVMAPGDTQEVVVGIVIAVGSNNINSVAALKEKDRAAQIAYDLDFNLTPSPPSPRVHAIPQDRAITLWWEPNAENYDGFDPLLTDTIRLNVSGTEIIIPVNDKTYSFEGYQVWQFRDQAGTDPILLATYDLANGITEIKHYQYDYLTVNDAPLPSEPYITGNDEGVRRYVTIRQNAYTNAPLNNANPYYFAVTSYGYSKYSDPPVLESPAQILEVFPGRPAIDVLYPNDVLSNVYFDQTSGWGDGLVYAKVIDPNALTGHRYEVVINPGGTSYNFFNRTTGDTLLLNSTDFGTDSLHKDFIDGFMLIVQNIGRDRVTGPPAAPIRIVEETKGPGGVEVAPKNVFSTATTERLNSTAQWTIRTVNLVNQTVENSLQNFAFQPLGTDDYEIRFTEEGSEYYTSGYGAPLNRLVRATDPKGVGRVPFEVWRIPANPAESPERLVIKIFDRNQDTTWNAQSGLYESIYTFRYTGGYPSELAPVANATTGGTVQGNYRLGNFAIQGDVPAPGTVIRLSTWKPLTENDVFSSIIEGPRFNSIELAKENIDEISVFPNPYLGASALERDKYQRFMRFTNLPGNISIRIFSLSGVFIRKLEKINDNSSQYLDWDLRNKDGLPVASGVYLAYLDIPNVGSRVMKLAVIMETQFIDRL